MAKNIYKSPQIKQDGLILSLLSFLHYIYAHIHIPYIVDSVV